MPQPASTTLASGQVTDADQIEVVLHTPATEPAFILVVWPAAPSVARADDSFDRLVARTFKILADAYCPSPPRRRPPHPMNPEETPM